MTIAPVQSGNCMLSALGNGVVIPTHADVLPNASSSLFFDRFVAAAQIPDLQPEKLHEEDGLSRRASRIGFGSISVSAQEGATSRKHVRFFPSHVNTWMGVPYDIAHKIFGLHMRVADYDEGNAIAEKILKAAGIVFDGDLREILTPQRVYIEIPERLSIQMQEIPGKELKDLCEEQITAHPNVRALPIDEGWYELALQFKNSTQGIQAAASVYSALLQYFDLHMVSLEGMRNGRFDMSTRLGRGEWAYHAFYEWGAELSDQEVRALKALGGYDYKALHAYLRKHGASGNSYASQGGAGRSLVATVNTIDSALARGTIDRDVELFRATRQPFGKNAAEAASAERAVSTFTDAAYTFASLDPGVAKWWNEMSLNGQGQVVKIDVPRGARAAYLDVEQLFPYRGCQEIVLPRGSTFEVVSTSSQEEDMPRLKLM